MGQYSQFEYENIRKMKTTTTTKKKTRRYINEIKQQICMIQNKGLSIGMAKSDLLCVVLCCECLRARVCILTWKNTCDYYIQIPYLCRQKNSLFFLCFVRGWFFLLLLLLFLETDDSHRNIADPKQKNTKNKTKKLK